jgi:hypothetical protein
MVFLCPVPTCLMIRSNGLKDRKMKKHSPLIVTAILTFALMACSGNMKGIDRYSGRRVFFAYTNDKFGSAEIQVTMPDGERFMGRIVEEPVDTQAAAPSGKSYPTVDQFSGNTDALLEGDRGSNMKCKFRLSDKVFGFKSGGFGLCETSDGRVIDIFAR